MKIQRTLKKYILADIHQHNKILALYGPRQVGKTTLVQDIAQEVGKNTLYINADEERYNTALGSRDLNRIMQVVGHHEMLIIDEAQRIENIGLGLKILHDAHPEIQIIITGSSSIDLATRVSEPLTGRMFTYTLYPLSFFELRETMTDFDLHTLLQDALVTGLYPEVFTSLEPTKTRMLRTIATSYLYRDVLEMEGLHFPRKLRELLTLLAFQVGSEVSMHEIGTKLGLHAETVRKYIDLLEQSFVIFRLTAFSRNLRNEVMKKEKIYFYDLGVRNMLVDNLNSLDKRDDIGALWENFLMIERRKYLMYTQRHMSSYFWRLTSGAEIDLIEVSGGQPAGYEFKWGKKNGKKPEKFLETYEGSSIQYVHQENFLDFIA